jgi:hypothetical protein
MTHTNTLFFVVKGPAAGATDASQPLGLLCKPLMKMIIFFVLPCNGASVEWNWQVKTEVLGEKPVPVPLCPPQIPYGLTRNGSRASAVRGRRLTAWAMARRTHTLSRTPLDEWSARRRDLYLTTHNTHKRQTSMPPAGLEPTIPASERPQTLPLDRAATGIGVIGFLISLLDCKFFSLSVRELIHPLRSKVFSYMTSCIIIFTDDSEETAFFIVRV